jgi:uncharacterized caspase-like protein
LLQILFCSFVVGALWVAPSHAEKRVALVIGNSSYRSVPNLPNARNDADAVAAALRAARFDVVESRNDLGIKELRRAVGDFAEVAHDADIAVVYYAGHGIEVDGTNYLIPIDAVLARDFDVEDEAFSLDRVVKAIDPARQLRLVILDACRENPFLRKMKRSVASRSITRGLAQVEPTVADTLIAFSAKAGSVALDGDGKNSPFTSALVRHLTTPGLDIRFAFGLVRDDVLAATQRRQEPFLYGSLGGHTVALVESPASKPIPTAGAPSLHDSLAGLIALGVPSMSASNRDGIISEYESWQVNKAIALAPSRGTWKRWSRTSSAQVEEEKTLEACQVYYGQPCAILAVNDQVVADTSGNWQLRDMARVRYSGAFDPDRVPVAWPLTNTAVVDQYRASKGPKAAVLHPWGYLLMEWDKPDQNVAEQRAFDRCNNDPRTNGRDGPCYLYAVGDQVVLSKRQTRPRAQPDR